MFGAGHCQCGFEFWLALAPGPHAHMPTHKPGHCAVRGKECKADRPKRYSQFHVPIFPLRLLSCSLCITLQQGSSSRQLAMAAGMRFTVAREANAAGAMAAA